MPATSVRSPRGKIAAVTASTDLSRSPRSSTARTATSVELQLPPTEPRARSAGPPRFLTTDDLNFAKSPPFKPVKRSNTTIGISRNKTQTKSQQQDGLSPLNAKQDSREWDLGVSRSRQVKVKPQPRKVRARSFVLENLNISSIPGGTGEEDNGQVNVQRDKDNEDATEDSDEIDQSYPVKEKTKQATKRPKPKPRKVRARSFVLENLNISSIQGAIEKDKELSLLDHLTAIAEVQNGQRPPLQDVKEEEEDYIDDVEDFIKDHYPEDNKKGIKRKSRPGIIKDTEESSDGFGEDIASKSDHLNRQSKNKEHLNGHSSRSSKQSPRLAPLSGPRPRIVFGENSEADDSTDDKKERRKSIMEEVLGKMPEKQNPQRKKEKQSSGNAQLGVRGYVTQEGRDVKLATTLYKLRREHEGRSSLRSQQKPIVIPHGQTPSPESGAVYDPKGHTTFGRGHSSLLTSSRGQPEGMSADSEGYSQSYMKYNHGNANGSQNSISGGKSSFMAGETSNLAAKILGIDRSDDAKGEQKQEVVTSFGNFSRARLVELNKEKKLKMMEPIRYFVGPPMKRPRTVCIDVPGAGLSHKQVKRAFDKVLSSYSGAKVVRIQFELRTVMLGEDWVDNRWIITVNKDHPYKLLLGKGVKIKKEQVRCRSYDDVMQEEYRKYLNYMSDVSSDYDYSEDEHSV